MKIEEIRFPSEAKLPANRQHFLTEILNNKWQVEQYRLATEIAEESEDSEDFINKFISDPRTAQTQLYAEILKAERPERIREALSRMLNDKFLIAYSDAGGVKIGNAGFGVIVPNGKGDGRSYVAIVNDRNKFNESLVHYWTTIEGADLEIYANDFAPRVSGNVIATLSGRYHVFYAAGIVVFVKLN